MQKRTGLQEFKSFAEDFRQVFKAPAIIAAALPVATGLLQIAPPWPNTVPYVTSLIDLIILIAVYHFLNRTAKITIDKIMKISAISLFALLVIYFAAYSLLVFQVPPDGYRGIRGLTCGRIAIELFQDECPFLGLDRIAGAGYEAERIWTLPSIACSRIILLVAWLGVFFCISTFAGAFTVFQRTNIVKGA